MPINPNLLAKAYRAPQSLTFNEALALAKQLLFEEVGGKGSHRFSGIQRAKRLEDIFRSP
jgi:hypothetical protein